MREVDERNFSKDWRCDWIVQILNYGYCEPVLWRFYGSEEEVKEKLVQIAEEDRKGHEESWKSGATCKDDIVKSSPWELFASGSYEEEGKKYEIEYIATKLSHIEML